MFENCFCVGDNRDYLEYHFEIGDLLLVASDGFFDNLSEDFIVQMINNNLVKFI